MSIEHRVAHVSMLQEGDFITSSEWFYNIEHSSIALVTFSPYDTHAMIYIGANHIVEATGKGVNIRNLPQALTSPFANAYTVADLTQKQRKTICQYALDMLKTPYDLWPSVFSGVDYPAAGPACFCSGLVAGAYLKAGISLTRTKTPNPGALANSNYSGLRWRGWLKCPDPDIRAKCDQMLYQPGEPTTWDEAVEWATRRR